MARMYPESGPQPGSSRGERIVYDLLKHQLDDAYLVFHSVPWPHERGRRRPLDVEIDFVVVHPQRGVLVLEVKGGDVRRDGSTGRWVQRDWDGSETPITDPVRQVTDAMYALRRRLQTTASTRPYFPHEAFARGIWFPECRFRTAAQAAAMVEADLILDGDDAGDVMSGLQRVYDFFHAQTHGVQPDHPLPPAAIDAVLQLLAPTIHGPSSLALVLAHEEQQFLRLTEMQFSLLHDILQHPRLLVPGAAGTGKTVLAVEAAWRLALLGYDVLFLCQNDFLAESIAARIADDPRHDKPSFAVHSLRSLSLTATTTAQLPDQQLKAARSQAAYVQALRESLEVLMQRETPLGYDVVLVDEAQVLEVETWSLLPRLLRDDGTGRLYVFYDPDQRDSDGPWVPPALETTVDTTKGPSPTVLVPLRDNLRNTQAIFSDMQQLNPHLARLRCLGPIGRPAKYFPPQDYSTRSGTRARVTGAAEGSADEAEATALRAALEWLTGPAGMHPEDILILSCRSLETSRWRTQASLQRIGPYRFTWKCSRQQPGVIALATIRMAMGLEQKVVILSELDGLDRAPNRARLLYRAISRAVHQLVILGTASELEAMSVSAKPAGASRVASSAIKHA